MSLDESLAQQSGRHLPETGPQQWQENASDVHMVAGLRLTRGLATAQNGHRPRDMTDWHLIAVLLDLELLEFDEFGAACLQIQSTARFVNTAIFRRTIGHWHE